MSATGTPRLFGRPIEYNPMFKKPMYPIQLVYGYNHYETWYSYFVHCVISSIECRIMFQHLSREPPFTVYGRVVSRHEFKYLIENCRTIILLLAQDGVKKNGPRGSGNNHRHYIKNPSYIQYIRDLFENKDTSHYNIQTECFKNYRSSSPKAFCHAYEIMEKYEKMLGRTSEDEIILRHSQRKDKEEAMKIAVPAPTPKMDMKEEQEYKDDNPTPLPSAPEMDTGEEVASKDGDPTPPVKVNKPPPKKKLLPSKSNPLPITPEMDIQDDVLNIAFTLDIDI